MTAVLFARSDSVYKTLPGLDVYDLQRDARNWNRLGPVIAHPPCRGWGRLRALANVAPGELELAYFAVHAVRAVGGVIEHPAGSTLWSAAELPRPGARDTLGGWTLPIDQYSFGHRAKKFTWLYIVGVSPASVPPIPLVLGDAPRVIGSSGRRLDGTRLRAGDAGFRTECTKAEREHTPVQLARWLVELAGRVVSPSALGGVS